MSVDKVKKYFAGYGMESRVLEFDVSSATVELAYKVTFGKKAKMLTQEQVTELIGHAVGGVCPFAAGEKAVVYLDESLKEFDFVYPACGAPNNCGRFTPQELEEITQCLGWVDVCKGKDVE